MADALIAKTFTFSAPHLAKFAHNSIAGNKWDSLLDTKDNRKISSDSYDTPTTANSIGDLNFKDSQKSSSPSTQSPRESWDWKSPLDAPESQEDSFAVYNSAMKPKKKVVTDDTKYKTELCKNWAETKQCPYGRKCKFAHGKHELNEKLLCNKRRYKSKKCNSFHSTMTCPYGSRCLFAHEQRTVEELQREYFERMAMNSDLIGSQLNVIRKRLPIFIAAIDNEPREIFSPIKSPIKEEFEEEFSNILKLCIL